MADQKHPKSLRNVKVEANVRPNDDRTDSEHTKRIARAIKKQVKDTLKENEDKPSCEQVGKAFEKVSEKNEELKADGTDVDVGVAVVGTRGEDGETEIHMHATGKEAKEMAEEADEFPEEDDD
ncbi:hypothetical protein HYT45_03545 [Candidatus Uhrbacteria bacterium]|nr:hypothetical protein [Candidatus Uhrbacteria bacterium]